MEMTVFTTALLCTIVLALSLFKVELNGLLSMETMVAFINTTAVLMLMLIYCYLSECLTSDLLEVGDIFYNSMWYQLPVSKQRLLVLPIARAQRVFRLRGLGLFDCSLVVFSSVQLYFLEDILEPTNILNNSSFSQLILLLQLQIVQTAGSYFIVLRSFN